MRMFNMPILDAIHVDLNQNLLLVRGRSMKLWPRQAELMYVMVHDIGRVVPIDRAVRGVYGAQAVRNPERVLSQIVRQLIAPLADLGLTLEFVGKDFRLTECV